MNVRICQEWRALTISYHTKISCAYVYFTVIITPPFLGLVPPNFGGTLKFLIYLPSWSLSTLKCFASSADGCRDWCRIWYLGNFFVPVLLFCTIGFGVSSNRSVSRKSHNTSSSSSSSSSNSSSCRSCGRSTMAESNSEADDDRLSKSFVGREDSWWKTFITWGWDGNQIIQCLRNLSRVHCVGL